MIKIKSWKPFRKLYHRTSWSLSILSDKESLQWAIIKGTEQGPVIYDYGTSDTIDKALKKRAQTPSDAVYISSVFPSLPTLCRQIDLPKLHQNELKPAIFDSLEQSFSSDIENTAFCYETTSSEKEMTTITAFVTRKKEIQNHIDTLSSLSIDPEYIFPKAACLAAFIAFFSISNWQYVVDIGEKETSATLILDGRVIESRSLIGGMDIFSCIEAPPSTTDSQVHQLLKHINETLLAFQNRYSFKNTPPLTVTGNIIHLAKAPAVIAEFVHAPLSPLHSTKDQTLLAFASTIGAAFLGQPKNTNNPPPNFRSFCNLFPNPLLHWKKPLYTFVLSALCLSLLFWGYGQIRVQQITNAMNSDWSSFFPEKKESLETGLELLDAAQERLYKIEQDALFPLQPNIPTLSDTLIWLSHLVETIQGQAPKEIISLHSIHYCLVKRPSRKTPKEQYQVRVDLEITTSSVVLARAFHEHLLKPNSFISKSSDIKWVASNGKYFAGFFLNDNTFYPPKEL